MGKGFKSAMYSENKLNKYGIQEKATLNNRGSIREKKPALGIFTTEDLLVGLKGLALDPCNMASSQYLTQKLPQEMLRIRKCMMENSKRKKDLEQFFYGGVFTAVFELSREKSHKQNGMKKRRGQFSSISCPPRVSAKGDSFQGKQVTNAFPDFVDTSNCILLKEDSIESIIESNQVKQENLVVGNGYPHSTKKSVQEKSKIGNVLQVPKSLVLLKDPIKSSRLLKPKNEDKLKPAHKFLLSYVGGNSLRRPIIPIGPRFQADVPKWEGPHN